jgi:hypothetical protein
VERDRRPKVTGGPLRIVLPVDPPELSPRSGRILMEILLQAAPKAGAMSASRGTITFEKARQEARER